MINIGGFTGLSNSIKIGGGISSFNPFRMIDNGILINATFERSGDVVALINAIPVVFGPNEPVVVDARLIHHGAITETTPTYDISPLVRPTAPDVYDTAASAPNPDKHGANWEFSDPKNAWAWNLLDGVADGVEIVRPLDSDWTELDNATVLNGVITFTLSLSSGVAVQLPSPEFVAGDFYEVTYEVLENDANIDLFLSGAGFTTSTLIERSLGLHRIRVECTINDGKVRIVAGTGSDTGVVRVADISVKKVIPSTGTLTLKPLNIVPAKTQWQTVGDFNILSGDDDLAVSQILYVEQTTGLICATDGTNTCKSATEYIAGTDHQVDLIFSGSQMAIVLDGVQGTASAFTGHFPVGVTIKQGFENEDVWSPGDIYGQPGTPVIL